MIRAVAFDFDHTLYDRDATYVKMLDAYRMRLGRFIHPRFTPSQLLKTLQEVDRQGTYNDSWRGIYQASLDAGVFENAPGYAPYFSIIEEIFPPSIVLYPDTLSTFHALKGMGYRLAILTNGPSGYQHDKIVSAGVADGMDAIVVSGDVGKQKPDPAPFERVAELLELPLSQIVYVGDNPVCDVDGARKAGMTPVWFRSFGYWPSGLTPAAYAADRLGELPDLLRRIASTGHEAHTAIDGCH